jgi:serine/threonine protein kinase
MKKKEIFVQRCMETIMKEKEILARVRHRFMANIYFAFQDTNNLYLVTEFVRNGDLAFQLDKRRKFKEEQARFIIASLVIILQYLHFNQVMHRNITPTNILFDNKGYIRLNDFSIAREFSEDNS